MRKRSSLSRSHWQEAGKIHSKQKKGEAGLGKFTEYDKIRNMFCIKLPKAVQMGRFPYELYNPISGKVSDIHVFDFDRLRTNPDGSLDNNINSL
jgi:hypothetical protein